MPADPNPATVQPARSGWPRRSGPVRGGWTLATVVATVAVLLFLLGAVLILSWSGGRLAPATAQPPYVDATPEASLRELVHVQERVHAGQILFLSHCTLCHGVHGEGAVGPNLRDNYWLGGNEMQSIVARIADGAPLKGMVGWRNVLNKSELESLAAYVASLAGSEDGTGKAPEGALRPITWK